MAAAATASTEPSTSGHRSIVGRTSRTSLTGEAAQALLSRPPSAYQGSQGGRASETGGKLGSSPASALGIGAASKEAPPPRVPTIIRVRFVCPLHAGAVCWACHPWALVFADSIFKGV